MANSFFQFKQFTVRQDRCAMKVTTDACLFGAWVAEEMKIGKKEIESALDIGTGTGLLSLMIAQQHKVLIDAIEIDKDAADQAAENIQASGFKYITVKQANVIDLEPIQYDCIFSNPPFYEAELASPDAKRQAAHHGSALRWESLFKLVGQQLARGGYFYLLLPFKRQSELAALLQQNKLYAHNIIAVKPTTQHLPTRLLVGGSFNKEVTVVKELSIKDEAGNYTPEFVSLLKDYYLYL